MSRGPLSGALWVAATLGCIQDSPGTDAGPQSEVLLEGDLVIRSALDLQRASAYARVTGNLSIREVEDAPKISLPRLREVAGAVEVADLAGGGDTFVVDLPRLSRVGLNVRVSDVDVPILLDLPALEFVGGHLDLRRCRIDSSLERLAAVNGSIVVRDVELSGLELPALSFVGGALSLSRVALPTGGEPPIRLALPVLATVGSDLEIRQSGDMMLDARSLTTIGGDIEISLVKVSLEAPRLRTVGGDLRAVASAFPMLALGALEEVGGRLELSSVMLTESETIDLSGLRAVAQNLVLSAIGGLVRLRFDALSNLGSSIEVAQNGRLASIEMPVLVSAVGDLIVSENGPIEVDLPLLRSVGGNLMLDRNGTVSCAFPVLEDVRGNVEIASSVVSALALPLLQRVGRNLSLTDLTWSVRSLSLPSLSSVDGTLGVSGSRFLEDASLPSLRTIGSAPGGFVLGDLVVRDSSGLRSLSLDALESIAVDAVIRDNPDLDGAAVADALSDVALGGRAVICGNLGDPPCP